MYLNWHRDDERRVENKFKPMLEAGDSSWRSDMATKFESWCLSGAWVQCEECHRLEKRPLEPVDIEGCKHCKTKEGGRTGRESDSTT